MADWKKKVRKLFRVPVHEFRLKLNEIRKYGLDFEIPDKKVIYFANGLCFHGGLVDRFKGMVSAFYFARNLNIDFEANFSYPVALNRYYEIIPESAHPHQVKFFPLFTAIDYSIDYFHKNLFLKLGRKIIWNRVLHVYCNIDAIKDKQVWGKYFNELLSPTPFLKSHLVDEDKVSIHFRFSATLGDFNDIIYKELPESRQIQVMDYCVERISELVEIHAGKPVYLFTDSQKFKEYAIDHIPSIKTLPVLIKHIDDARDADQNHDGTFIEFFNICHSSYIYSIFHKDIRLGNFARYASYVNQVPYSIIRENEPKLIS